jgi:hypothetical protein
MAVRAIRQQQSQQGTAHAVLFWQSPQATHQLDGHGAEKIPKIENTRRQVGRQGSIPKVPPQRIDSSANLHSTPRT